MKLCRKFHCAVTTGKSSIEYQIIHIGGCRFSTLTSADADVLNLQIIHFLFFQIIFSNHFDFLIMMMNALNTNVRYRRKGYHKEIPIPDAEVLICLLRSRVQDVWGSPLQDGQRGLGISHILSEQERRELQNERRWESEVLQGEGDSPLLLKFAKKKSEGRGLELENIWIGKLLHHEGI